MEAAAEGEEYMRHAEELARLLRVAGLAEPGVQKPAAPPGNTNILTGGQIAWTGIDTERFPLPAPLPVSP